MEVDAGEAVPASFTKRFYKGEKTFTVAAGQTTVAEVECKRQNVVAEVKFDATVSAAFGENFHAWVVAADAFDEGQVQQGGVPALNYTADGTGYFTMPEGVTTLTTRFEGTHPDRGVIVREARFEGVQTGGKYSVSFRFSKDLPGFIQCVVIKVNTDPDEQDEMRSNLAFVADFDHFSEDAYFGLNDYTGNQNSLALNLMYNHYFTYRSSLIVGVQGHLDYYREKLLNPTPWIAANSVRNYDFDRNEREAGAYAEYTYAIKDKFSIVAGVRGDYNAFYDKFFVTPRGHIRWNITPSTTLRASGGLGYRSTNVITDNIGVLATGRAITFLDNESGKFDFRKFDRMEKALTVGGSLTQTFGLVNPGDATLSFDYFRTQFYNSVVADQEMYADRIVFYDTDGRSYTDTYQIDFSWSPVERLDIFATFRYTDSEMTIRRADGGTARVERPLVSQYKTLLNIQYATKFRRWVFDATAQLNGPARIPTQTGDLDDSYYSPRYPMFFAQVSRKVGKFDIYAGCENIADYRQKDPILNAQDPYDYKFNSMNVWGPLMGRKFYVGLRFNLY